MRKLETAFLSAILIIAGVSYLSYWWIETDVTPQNRVVDLWGIDPFSIGLQYGLSCKNEIQGICSGLTLVDGLFKLITNLASIHFTFIMQPFVPKEYLIEMCGVALGAGVTYNQIFFLNYMADYMQILSESAMSCSQFILINNTLPIYGPMFGRTLDYPGDVVLDRYQVIIRLNDYPGSGHSIIGHTIAGMIGYLTGINEEGLTIGVSQINPHKIDIGPGMSCVLAIRDILQHNETTEQAAKTFGDYERHTVGAWCFAILDGNGSAAVVELAHKIPDTQEVFNNTIKGDDLPFMVITNHFISPEMYPLSAHSQQSEARFDALLHEIPKIPYHDLSSAINLLKSHYDPILKCNNPGHRTVCNHGIQPYHGTMGGFIGVPKTPMAVFCLGRPCESDFYIMTFEPINYLIGPIT